MRGVGRIGNSYANLRQRKRGVSYCFYKITSSKNYNTGKEKSNSFY